jgi:hypothetical protein
MNLLIKLLLASQNSRKFARVLAWVEKQSFVRLFSYFILAMIATNALRMSALGTLAVWAFFLAIFYKLYLRKKAELDKVGSSGEPSLPDVIKKILAEAAKNAEPEEKRSQQEYNPPPSAPHTSNHPHADSPVGKSAPIISGRRAQQQDVVWRKNR